MTFDKGLSESEIVYWLNSSWCNSLVDNSSLLQFSGYSGFIFINCDMVSTSVLCITNSYSCCQSCHSNRKGRRDNTKHMMWVRHINQWYALYEPLKLYCGVVLWAIFCIRHSDNIELPILQSIFDFKAQKHKGYWPGLYSVAFIGFGMSQKANIRNMWSMIMLSWIKTKNTLKTDFWNQIFETTLSLQVDSHMWPSFLTECSVLDFRLRRPTWRHGS